MARGQKSKAAIPVSAPTSNDAVPPQLVAQLPGMTDEGLVNLLANAQRLEQTGVEKQRVAATMLIPLITGEIATRKANKPARVAKVVSTARAVPKGNPRGATRFDGR